MPKLFHNRFNSSIGIIKSGRFHSSIRYDNLFQFLNRYHQKCYCHLLFSNLRDSFNSSIGIIKRAIEFIISLLHISFNSSIGIIKSGYYAAGIVQDNFVVTCH